MTSASLELRTGSPLRMISLRTPPSRPKRAAPPETAALRNFDRGYDRLGSKAPEMIGASRQRLSGLPRKPTRPH
jgi:hypothetical protein